MHAVHTARRGCIQGKDTWIDGREEAFEQMRRHMEAQGGFAAADDQTLSLGTFLVSYLPSTGTFPGFHLPYWLGTLCCSTSIFLSSAVS